MRKVPFVLRVCKRLKPLFPSEALYLKTRFRLEMGYKLNLKHPKTFSEKLQWLKLYNRRPEYTTMVDKYAAKDYVAGKIGPEYIIPTFGVWNKPEDIAWDSLPNSFVLKTTHGGSNVGVIICKDKKTIDKAQVTEVLRFALKQDIAKYSCEWPYKNVPRRVLAEEYITPATGNQSEKGDPEVSQTELLEYKFFCFNGRVEFMKVNLGRSTGLRANYYDREFHLLPFGEAWYMPDVNAVVNKPKEFEKMIQLAERLSEGVPFLRVDLYDTGRRILFSELTFFPASGLENIKPDGWDEKIGDLLVLPTERIV